MVPVDVMSSWPDGMPMRMAVSGSAAPPMEGRADAFDGLRRADVGKGCRRP